MIDIGQVWKIAATSLAIVPGLFGVTHFMVKASMESMNTRVLFLEKQMGLGARFTAHDGEVIRSQMHDLISRHERDIDARRAVDEKIIFEDATLKANQQSVMLRITRMEQKLYAWESSPNEGDFKNAPFRIDPGQGVPFWYSVDWQTPIRSSH
jgi:hypothetical protein